MQSSELKVGDLIIFGRSNTIGQYTAGWIKAIQPKTIRVISLSARGRPPKPKGVNWRCHPNVIQTVVTTGNPADSCERDLTPIEVLLVQAKMGELKASRKKTMGAWQTELPKNRKGWFWREVFPSSGEAKTHSRDCLMRITRVNQKSLSVQLVYKKHGVFNLDEPHTVYPGKMNGHKIVIKKNFQHRAEDILEDNNNKINPWTEQMDRIEKRRKELADAEPCTMDEEYPDPAK